MKTSLYDFVTWLAVLLVAAVFLLFYGHFVILPDWLISALLIIICLTLLYAVFWLTELKLDMKKLIHFAKNVRQERYDTEAHLARSDEIHDLYEELFWMKEELREIHALEEELLQSVTHNLKMPVSVIYLTAECMKDGLYTEGGLEASCDKIMEVSQELSSQIETLIAINRNQYFLRHGEASDCSCNLKPLIEQQLFEVENMMRNQGLHCEVELYNVQYRGNDGQWQCVVQNLLENAMRYADSRIKICLYKTSLSFYNDGSNIADDMLNGIFEPYMLGEKGHTGLGLALVKSFVNLNGYIIEAKNLSDGVIFRISKAE